MRAVASYRGDFAMRTTIATGTPLFAWIALSVLASAAFVSACSGDPVSGGDGDGGSVGAGGASGAAGGPRDEPFRLDVQRVRIGSGADYTCAVTASGVVKCWGRNDKGQCGLGETRNRGDGPNEMGDQHPGADLGSGRRAVAVAVGWYHACALLDDGAVKCWGQNDAGQLGQGDTSNRGDGPGEMGDNLPPIPLAQGKRVVAISAGGYHNCALFEDGAVQCWGGNRFGQLGLGDTKARGGASGQMGANLPFVELGRGRRAVAISAGNLHTCAILDDGTLRCWGNGADGQIGLGGTAHRGDAPGEMGDDLPAVNVGGKVVAVEAGGFHTCAILESGVVKCWGHNDQGQQGNGDSKKRGGAPGEMGDALPVVQLGSGRTAKTLSTLYDHNCAVLDDGATKCWGWNNVGQLGLGDKSTRGKSAGDMGDALPVVQLGSGRSAVQLAAGWDHTCAVLDNDAVKCWGLNGAGHLGLGDRETRGDQPGEMGDALPEVRL